METKIIQISSGNGPVECQLAVAKTLKVFLKEIEKQAVKYELIDRTVGDEAHTLKSIMLEIKGNELSFLRNWAGAILWVFQSPYRKFHRRKNWFIAFEMHDAPKASDLKLNEVKFQTLRSSGPGGQHVNKTETAVRAIHIPTGLACLSQENRSQQMNKKSALKKLHFKLEKHKNESLKSDKTKFWETHLNIDRGNPIQTFKDTNKKH